MRRSTRSASKHLIKIVLLQLTTLLSAQDIVIGGFQDVQPYVFKQREEGKPELISGGIIKDIADEIARRTGLSFIYSFPPRKRLDIEIAMGTVHIIPMGDPVWLAKPDLMLWSSPVFKERLVFLTLTSFPNPITGGPDIEGLRVGMSQGFIYEELPDDLGFIREDAATVMRNIKRLETGWIDTLYGGELDIHYHIKDRQRLFTVQPWSPTTSIYRWAVSKLLGARGDLIISTLETMITDGTIDRIIARYQ